VKRSSWILPAIIANSLLACSTLAFAEGHSMTPASSLGQGPGMARTHLRLFVPSAYSKSFGAKAVQPRELPPFPGFLFETPASLACVYNLVPLKVKGCNPNLATTNPSGGGRAIAVVDAFHDPTANDDLEVFSAQFGLPAPSLTVVFAQGSKPGLDPTGGWELEESLDIQWAHAMAPRAKIFLVEAQDNSLFNLFNAVMVASSLVAEAGGGEVSMSWGSAEFSQETVLDSIFTTRGVVYFASTGDTPGPQYPSTSPNVIAAGGTTISRNTITGNLIVENAWQDAGGGPSTVEARPAYQNGIAPVVSLFRGTPDLAFDSNPATGVWIFDTNPVFGQGWFVVGGTSVASPSLAGIVNAAGRFRNSAPDELTTVYSQISNPNRFNDITFGNCGLSASNFAGHGWDFCTGIGSISGLDGK
jgi:subtilase family serine protease